ncbi:MAG TPA: hypothetical protein PLL88_06880 [Anaerolineaceae bacterium]|nr:hypothetical protein [Anaerolineaceae bacterium]
MIEPISTTGIPSFAKGVIIGFADVTSKVTELISSIGMNQLKMKNGSGRAGQIHKPRFGANQPARAH